MVAISWVREVGESFSLCVTDTEAAAENEANVVAKIALLTPGKWVLASDAVASLTLTTTYREATVDVDKGWYFSALSDDTAELAPGFYQMDILDTTAGVPVKAGPFYLRMRKAAV